MRRLSPGLLVGIVVAAGALATAASAADLPAPGPAPAYYPPAYRPVIYDWTGIYGGVHVGAGVMQDQVTTTTTTILQNAGAQTRYTPFAVVGGAQAGFNVEFAPFVVGAEGTFTWADISGSNFMPASNFGGLVAVRSTSAAHWYATVTGKIGFAANDFLFYAKGGGAWMNVNYTEDVTAGAVLGERIMTDTRTGFTVGGGAEFGMTENLSARVEYDFLDFGTKTYNFTSLNFTTLPPGGGFVPVAAFPVSIKSVTHLITVGLNYRFNWGGGGTLVTK
jgi:outer membrane immunogenic protein